MPDTEHNNYEPRQSPLRRPPDASGVAAHLQPASADLNQLPFNNLAVPSRDTAALLVAELVSGTAATTVTATVTHQTVWVPTAADM